MGGIQWTLLGTDQNHLENTRIRISAEIMVVDGRAVGNEGHAAGTGGHAAGTGGHAAGTGGHAAETGGHAAGTEGTGGPVAETGGHEAGAEGRHLARPLLPHVSSPFSSTCHIVRREDRTVEVAVMRVRGD